MTGSPPPNLQSRRAEWEQRVSELIHSVEEWCKELGWLTLIEEIQIREDRIGTYSLPQLRISLNNAGSVILIRPVALNIIAGDGRVDIESWPSLHRFKLIGVEGGWEIYTDSNVRWPSKWSKDTCIELMRELANA